MAGDVAGCVERIVAAVWEEGEMSRCYTSLT